MNKIDIVSFVWLLVVLLIVSTAMVILGEKNETYREIINKQNEIIKLQEMKIEQFKEKIQKKYVIPNVTVTAYSPSIEETDKDPDKTAIMEPPVIGYTCAVSRDLKFLLGKKIYIEGLGVFKVNDLMNKRYEKRVDLCMNKESAIKFGVQKHDIVIIDK